MTGPTVHRGEHDRLSLLFDGQRAFMDRVREREQYNGSPEPGAEYHGVLNSRQVQNRLHEIFGYTVREFSEAMAHLKKKPWRNEAPDVDRDEFEEEVIDTFHFFLEFMITAGITPEVLFEAYQRKMAVNVARQEGSY